MALEEGSLAPDFELESDTGDRVRLSGLRGRPVVLYFYPKDDTPGCTLQACEIRDSWSDFEERGAVVLGVSPDTVESHEKFRAKYDLPFTLLADPDHEVSELYGVWGEREYAGKSVILYFYPKDDTPGCTKESCDFRDNLVRFNASKADKRDV